MNLSADFGGDSEEQLRDRQKNEFRALKECFADQLVDLRKLIKVSKNPKKRKRESLWIPLELSVKIDTRPEPIAGFELHIKCSRKYPLQPPGIGFKNVRGIRRALISKLHRQLKQEAADEEHKVQGCIALLIMRAQQFLEDHYGDLELNNKSFYDQMVEQKQKCDKKAELSKKCQDEMDRLERERQVEEIRQKILRKRELYNESKKRRDSQSSTVENDPDESTYDYEGDLDGDSTNASVTSDGDTNRPDELEDLVEDEETLVRSRRSTFVGGQGRRGSIDERSKDLEPPVKSRLDLGYEVIEELGHGGFGTVYKVRNKVDSRHYALKKVKLNPDNETLNEKIMREVKLLSRLNHENVIRYYTAWSEVVAGDSYSKINITESGDDSALSPNINQESCILSQRDLSRSSDDEIDDVYHTSYLINDKNIERVDAGETTANYVVFETSDNKDENDIVESMKKALGPKLSDGESSDEDQETMNSSGKPKFSRWLYIQMELGQGTLREAIDQGLPKQKDRARRFFREILDGLCHIHRQGIIHRDLKPVNIFLDSMDRPKIGDFGLATTNLFIVTQSNGPGQATATAIKPNRMSLEKLRLLASPENTGSPGDGFNKSTDRLKYVQCNQTDVIGTPLYMSPELSATNEKTRISKVIYSHKVDVYSLGIIYFEMLYPLKTGHERVITLQDLRKQSITMPEDVEKHLDRGDIELIKLLLTHDVATRPTTEKLLTSNLLPSVGLKERECQNVIKQVVQNRQARTHKHMIRLLFEQDDSYVDDFVFDFEDIDSPNPFTIAPKIDTQGLLKDFTTNTFVLDQVKMKLEHILRSKGYVNFVTPTLMPKYSAAKYYGKQQLDDVVMLMDKNSSILTLPYDLRLPFARTIARTNINYFNRFAIERIFRQRQILGYHPDQLWECCVDIVSPPPPPGEQSNQADAEILNVMGDVVKSLPVLANLKPIIKINHIELVEQIMLMLNINQNQIGDILNCIVDSMSLSLKRSPQAPPVSQQNSLVVNQTGSSLAAHVKEDLKKDLLSSRLISNVAVINNLISLLEISGSTSFEVLEQIEQAFSSRSLKSSENLDRIRLILRSLDETICYAQGLGLDLGIRISAGYVLSALRPIDYYSGMVCLLECRRHARAKSKSLLAKTVVLAVGGRYDKLIEKFSRNRSEVFDQVVKSDANGSRSERENRSKVAVGASFGVEKISRLLLEDHVDRLNNTDQTPSPTINQLLQLNLATSNSSSTHQLNTTANPSIRYWPLDIAIYSLTYPKSRAYTSVVSGLIKQLRDKGLMCNEIVPTEHSLPLNSLAMHCVDNKIPYMMTIKAQSGLDLASGEDFWQAPAAGSAATVPGSLPSSKGSTSPHSPSPVHMSVIVTLYQIDKSRLRELKRCDIPSMIDFLLKR